MGGRNGGPARQQTMLMVNVSLCTGAFAAGRPALRLAAGLPYCWPHLLLLGTGGRVLTPPADGSRC